jgi:hypothetical protein
MEYPIYDKGDMFFAEKDGDTVITEFADFISQIVDNQIAENKIEAGILAFVNENGTKSLSDKQSFIFKKIIKPYMDMSCMVCGGNIPMNDVFEDLDGLCSYHAATLHKD